MFKNSTSEIILSSHPHFVFDSPFLNRIVFKFFDNEQQLIDNFIQGNVDFIEVKDLVTAQRLHQILRERIKIFSTPRPEKKVYFLVDGGVLPIDIGGLISVLNLQIY